MSPNKRKIIIPLLIEDELNSKQIARKANSSLAYVYQLRHEMKKLSDSKAQAESVQLTLPFESQDSAEKKKRQFRESVAVIGFMIVVLLIACFTIFNA
jgi:hypothetical protein